MSRSRLILAPPAALWTLSHDLLLRAFQDDRVAARLVVAPSSVVARLLVRDVARSCGAVAGLVPLTFHELAESMARPHVSATTLPDLAGEAIVAALLAADPGPFGARARRPGVVEAVAAVLRGLRDAGLDDLPEDDLDAFDRERVQHVGRLLAAYGAHLERHDLADGLALCRAAADGPLPGGAGSVLVHGVYELRGADLAVLDALCGRVDVTWVMPAMESLSTSASLLDETVLALQERGFEIETLDAGDADLAASLANVPEARLLACPGARAEAREVARGVLVAAAAGIAFGEMAVITAQESDVPRVIEALDRAHVPVADRPEPKLFDTPRGRALLALTRLLQGAGSRHDAVTVLRAHLAANEPAFPVARIENLLRRAGAGAPSAATWRTRLEALARTLARRADRLAEQPLENDDDAARDASEAPAAVETPESLRAEAQHARRLAAAAAVVLEAADVLAGEWTDWRSLAGRLATIARTALGDPALLPAIDAATELVAWLDRTGTRPGGRVTLAALAKPAPTAATNSVPDSVPEAVSDAVPEAVSDAVPGAVSDAALGVSLWTRRLASFAGERDMKTRRRPGEGVLVLDVARARGLRVRAAWLCGFADDVFPGLPAADPVLPDAARRAIREATGAPVAVASRRIEGCDVAFALALAAGAERVTCSWPRLDDATGGTRWPAEPLARLAERCTEQPLDPDDPASSPAIERVPAELPGLGDARRPLLDVTEYDLAAARDAVLGAHLADDAQLSRARRAHESRYRDRDLTTFDGQVGARPIERFTVTELETIAGCPLRYFFGSVLGLGDVQDAGGLEEPQRTDLGRLAHDVLEETLGRLAGRPVPEGEEAARVAAGVAAVTQRRLGELLADGVYGAPGLWRALAQRMARELARVVLDELAQLARQGLTIGSVELPREKSVEVKDGVELVIRGRVDRADTGPGGLRITDYKFSKTPPSFEMFDGGRRIQLPLYAWLLREEGSNVSEVRYLYLRADGKGNELLRTEAELAATEVDLLALVDRLADTARAGTFFAVPENCGVCAYRVVCGPGRTLVARRKDADPERVKFATLRESFK